MSGVLFERNAAQQLLQLLDAPPPSRDLVPPAKRRVDVAGRPQTVIGGRIIAVHGTVDATYDVDPANGADDLQNLTPYRVKNPPTVHWDPAAVGDPCILVVLPSLDGESTEYHLIAFTEQLRTVDCNAG